ncbi:hypothetical protein ACTMU2_26060 [Cupriavidus basilensis]
MATAATTSCALPLAPAPQLTDGQGGRAAGMPGASTPPVTPAVPARDGEAAGGRAQDAAFERLTDALRSASVSVQFEIDSTSHARHHQGNGQEQRRGDPADPD